MKSWNGKSEIVRDKKHIKAAVKAVATYYGQAEILQWISDGESDQ